MDTCTLTHTYVCMPTLAHPCIKRDLVLPCSVVTCTSLSKHTSDIRHSVIHLQHSDTRWAIVGPGEALPSESQRVRAANVCGQRSRHCSVDWTMAHKAHSAMQRLHCWPPSLLSPASKCKDCDQLLTYLPLHYDIIGLCLSGQC